MEGAPTKTKKKKKKRDELIHSVYLFNSLLVNYWTPNFFAAVDGLVLLKFILCKLRMLSKN